MEIPVREGAALWTREKTRSGRRGLYGEYECRLSCQADFVEGDDTQTGNITSVSVQGITVRFYPAKALFP